MGILSGFLKGFGTGVANTGQIYNQAKQQAIENLFREQQMALQERAATEAELARDYEQAFRTFSQMSPNSPVDPSQFGPGAAPIVEHFSREVETPDLESPLAGARSFEMSVSQAPYVGGMGQVGEMQPVQAEEARIAPQDLTPTKSSRVSVPMEDTRARTAYMTEMGRNSRASSRLQTQMQIAQLKANLTRQLATETNELKRQQLANELRRVQAYEQYVGNQGAYQGAQIENMNYDNELAAYLAEHGRPSTGGGAEADPMRAMLMQMLMNSINKDGATPMPAPGGAAPTKPAPAPRPKPPQPPTKSSGGEGESAYDRYLKRGQKK